VIPSVPLVGFLAMVLRLALRALARNLLRSTLTVLGILVGVAAVVSVSALGSGAQEQMEAQLASLGANLLVVFPGATATGGARGAAGTAQGMTEDDAVAIEHEVPSVRAVAPVLGASAQVVVGARNAATRVTGTTLDYFAVRNWSVSRGSTWTDSDYRTGAKVCVLGETVRRALFDSTDPVGSTLRIGRVPCTIVGVMTSKGQSSFGQDQDDVVLMPLSTFRARVSHRPGREIGMIMLSARDPRLTRRAETAVTALLRQRHHLGAGIENDFTVRNLSEIAQTFDAQRATIAMLLLAVASISLFVGGIGVMNIMLVSVTERTREIGLRLALGARGRDIMAQFLVEAVVLSLLGGLVGLGLGVLANTVIAGQTGWTLRLRVDTALLAVAVAGGIGVIFGFLPARRAASLDPIVALRHE